VNRPDNRLAAALADRYRIERELGAGGMATVYLAHDLKHDREVAIKVLHPELGAALGGERFLSEIKTTAKLQHPHILPLLDSGEADGLLYYVMPYVTGETLRARLQREQQLPIDDAVRIAREVADALGAAHAVGVIHRDIKPENILLQGGHALVADFGIALAVQSAGGARMTQTGLSLGTPQYMSPEQAMGERVIDARADIYALGAVTYEMLIGEPPFTGPSVQAIVARVMTEEPRSITVQRKAVPEDVAFAVLRCLEKLPADRFATALDFASALTGAGAGSAPRPRAAAARGKPATSRTRAIAIAIVAIAAGAGAAIGYAARRTPSAEAVRLLSIAVPDSARVSFNGNAEYPGGHGSLAMSPDGRRVAWVGEARAGVRLYMREMNGAAVRAVAGSEGAFAPFFSKDGTTLGYFSGSELRAVTLETGETRVVLRDVKEPCGAAFLSDGSILANSFFGNARIVSRSGAVQEFRFIDERGQSKNGRVVSFPSIVDGDAYAVAVSGETNEIVVLTIATRTVRIVRRASGVAGGRDESVQGAGARVAGNHLLWVVGDALMSAEFSASAARLTSEPVRIASGIRGDLNGVADVAVSHDGTVVFLPGGDPSIGQLGWVDARGRVDTLPLPAANYIGWSVSRDGRRLLTLTESGPLRRELRAEDLRNGTGARVDVGTGIPGQPSWSGDERSALVGIGFTESPGHLLRIAVDGRPKTDTLADIFVRRAVVSRDRRTIVFEDIDDASRRRSGFRVSVDGAPFKPISRPGLASPDLSPDGNWVAYDKADGRNDVFVEPFPGGGRRFQVSTDGGYEPQFSNAGDRIFYRKGRVIMVAGFHPTGESPVAKPTQYLAFDFADFLGRTFTTGADDRFLVKLLSSYASLSEIRVLTGALSASSLRAQGAGAAR
jgi:serine/threonine-protein kinase